METNMDASNTKAWNYYYSQQANITATYETQQEKKKAYFFYGFLFSS